MSYVTISVGGIENNNKEYIEGETSSLNGKECFTNEKKDDKMENLGYRKNTDYSFGKDGRFEGLLCNNFVNKSGNYKEKYGHITRYSSLEQFKKRLDNNYDALKEQLKETDRISGDGSSELKAVNDSDAKIYHSSDEHGDNLSLMGTLVNIGAITVKKNSFDVNFIIDSYVSSYEPIKISFDVSDPDNFSKMSIDNVDCFEDIVLYNKDFAKFIGVNIEDNDELNGIKNLTDDQKKDMLKQYVLKKFSIGEAVLSNQIQVNPNFKGTYVSTGDTTEKGDESVLNALLLAKVKSTARETKDLGNNNMSQQFKLCWGNHDLTYPSTNVILQEMMIGGNIQTAFVMPLDKQKDGETLNDGEHKALIFQHTVFLDDREKGADSRFYKKIVKYVLDGESNVESFLKNLILYFPKKSYLEVSGIDDMKKFGAFARKLFDKITEIQNEHKEGKKIDEALKKLNEVECCFLKAYAGQKFLFTETGGEGRLIDRTDKKPYLAPTTSFVDAITEYEKGGEEVSNGHNSVGHNEFQNKGTDTGSFFNEFFMERKREKGKMLCSAVHGHQKSEKNPFAILNEDGKIALSSDVNNSCFTIGKNKPQTLVTYAEIPLNDDGFPILDVDNEKSDRIKYKQFVFDRNNVGKIGKHKPIKEGDSLKPTFKRERECEIAVLKQTDKDSVTDSSFGIKKFIKLIPTGFKSVFNRNNDEKYLFVEPNDKQVSSLKKKDIVIEDGNDDLKGIKYVKRDDKKDTYYALIDDGSSGKKLVDISKFKSNNKQFTSDKKPNGHGVMFTAELVEELKKEVIKNEVKSHKLESICKLNSMGKKSSVSNMIATSDKIESELNGGKMSLIDDNMSNATKGILNRATAEQVDSIKNNTKFECSIDGKGNFTRTVKDRVITLKSKESSNMVDLKFFNDSNELVTVSSFYAEQLKSSNNLHAVAEVKVLKKIKDALETLKNEKGGKEKLSVIANTLKVKAKDIDGIAKEICKESLKSFKKDAPSLLLGK